MRKHTAEELKNPVKRKKFFEKEIDGLQLQIALAEKEYIDCQKS